MSNQTQNNDELLTPDKQPENEEGKKKNTSLAKKERSVAGFSLQPRNLTEALKICEYLASSSLVPKQYQDKPQDILVAINWGQEVGLKPLQALNSIAVVNGTPSMYGAAPLALARQHPEFEWILEDNEAFAYARDNVKGWGHLKNKNPDDTSICVVKRKGQPPVVREFSKEDVQKAGLGNVHKSYPKDMRKYRARSRGLEAAFGDVLKGIHQAEIVEENERMGVYDDDPKQPEERQQLNFGDEESTTEEPSDVVDTQEAEIVEEQEEEGLTQAERDNIMSDITSKAKAIWGQDWLKHIKNTHRDIEATASNMTELSDEALIETQTQISGLIDED